MTPCSSKRVGRETQTAASAKIAQDPTLDILDQSESRPVALPSQDNEPSRTPQAARKALKARLLPLLESIPSTVVHVSTAEAVVGSLSHRWELEVIVGFACRHTTLCPSNDRTLKSILILSLFSSQGYSAAISALIIRPWGGKVWIT